jgi:hypothetical protein
MKQNKTSEKRSKSTTVRIWKERIWPSLTKTRKRQFFSVVFAVLLLVLLGIIAKDYLVHKSIDSSLEKVRQALEDTDVPNQTKSVGCGRADEKFGKGAKTCSISLGDRFEAVSLEQASGIVASYNTVIEQSGDFEIVKQFDPNKGGLGSSKLYSLSNGGYIHKRSGRSCNLSYDFTEKGSRIAFACSNTSWFTRIFY